MDYTILTNQFGPHPKLLQQTLRHANSAFNRPITPRNLFAWDLIHARIQKKPMPVILDSGCGKGLSSRILARKYPEHWIIAMDQSYSNAIGEVLADIAEREKADREAEAKKNKGAPKGKGGRR